MQATVSKQVANRRAACSADVLAMTRKINVERQVTLLSPAESRRQYRYSLFPEILMKLICCK